MSFGKNCRNPVIIGILRMVCRIQNEEMMKMEEGLGRNPPQGGEMDGKVTILVDLTVKIW